MNSDKNYYEILEITPASGMSDIHSAYKKAINTYSAEGAAMYSLMSSDEAKQITSQIEEAYSVIGDSEKRIQYDRVKGFIQSDKQSIPESHVQYRETSERESITNLTKSIAQNKFALDFQVDSGMETDIENCESFTGDFLKTVREYKNVSLERMADLTKVSKTHLRHIEEDLIDKLPAMVYTRGFVYQYAKSLKLNADLVAKSYVEHTKELKKLMNEQV